MNERALNQWFDEAKRLIPILDGWAEVLCHRDVGSVDRMNGAVQASVDRLQKLAAEAGLLQVIQGGHPLSSEAKELALQARGKLENCFALIFNEFEYQQAVMSIAAAIQEEATGEPTSLGSLLNQEA